MEHTYLNEGRWEASGEYWDSHGKKSLLEGSSTVTRFHDVWILEGKMTLLLNPSVELTNTYRIVPLGENSEWTSWESQNSAIGTLRGRFAFIGDTILSSWESDDHRYSGIETLVCLHPSAYSNKGIFFRGAEKLSSWAVVLKKRQ